MARMKIFNSMEKEVFESPPLFDSAERKRFFSLSLMLNHSMATLRTPTNKVCFMVTAGYFKARHKFFARQFRQTDIEYVARQIEAVRTGSISTWKHVNLHGEYDFPDEKMVDSVGLASPKNPPLKTA